ncbi:hypothetical protein pb186bvf_009261 [Paramecium bursaria]
MFLFSQSKFDKKIQRVIQKPLLQRKQYIMINDNIHYIIKDALRSHSPQKLNDLQNSYQFYINFQAQKFYKLYTGMKMTKKKNYQNHKIIGLKMTKINSWCAIKLFQVFLQNDKKIFFNKKGNNQFYYIVISTRMKMTKKYSEGFILLIELEHLQQSQYERID